MHVHFLTFTCLEHILPFAMFSQPFTLLCMLPFALDGSLCHFLLCYSPLCCKLCCYELVLLWALPPTALFCHVLCHLYFAIRSILYILCVPGLCHLKVIESICLRCALTVMPTLNCLCTSMLMHINMCKHI